jgi:DNA processing protein
MIVVEARERSGALITADLALEEGREVFAVPGEITSALSNGTNDLLRLGATPLTGACDVLELFGLSSAAPAPVELSETADTVLGRLRDGPASADELARATGLEAGVLASALTELELAGVAVAAGGVFRAN